MIDEVTNVSLVSSEGYKYLNGIVLKFIFR